MKRKAKFNPIESKIIEVLGKGENLSINEIADRIKETRYKTLKNLKNLKKKKWIEEVN